MLDTNYDKGTRKNTGIFNMLLAYACIMLQSREITISKQQYTQRYQILKFDKMLNNLWNTTASHLSVLIKMMYQLKDIKSCTCCLAYTKV